MSHPLNDVVFARLGPSPIHGIGVFAIRDIPMGTKFDGGGALYSRLNEETIRPEIMALIRDRWLKIDQFNVLPNPNLDQMLQRFMNHSDDPNTDGHVTLRDIKAGEELTEDYRDPEMSDDQKRHYSFLK